MMIFSASIHESKLESCPMLSYELMMIITIVDPNDASHHFQLVLVDDDPFDDPM